MDEGPILAQAAVPVLDGDTEDTLADRGLVQEHAIYPAALEAFASGRAAARAPATAVLLNPMPI
jgi:phosphoribosylglycinamide formyltransferase 1